MRKGWKRFQRLQPFDNVLETLHVWWEPPLATYPSNLPDPHHVLGPMRAQQHSHMTPQDNLELEIIPTMKREQMRALDQYHVTSRDNLDLKIIRTLPENIILRSREHHVT